MIRTFAALAVLVSACRGELGAQTQDASARLDMISARLDFSAQQQDMPLACFPLDGGGNCALNLPEVPVSGGIGKIASVSYAVNNFYLDVYEVTVGAYRACMNSTSGGHCTVAPDTGSGCNWTSSPGTKENHPINCVDWNQATTFCAWAGRRLPTEGEWAYAAFGKQEQMSSYPWGSGIPLGPGLDGGLPQLCWDFFSGTCPVGSFPKTLFGMPTSTGVADLAGNVWEWTDSQYNDPYVPLAPTCTSKCSRRGGSWYGTDTTRFGPAGRNYVDPPTRGDDIGFRCARSAP